MDGYKTKHGGWSNTSTVANVIDNPLYSGVIHFDGVRAKGRHVPIVSAELERRVKDRRSRLARLDSHGDSSYLLTGILYCDACGARYFAHRRPNGTQVYSCHSRAKKNRKMIKNPDCKAPHIPVEQLDALVEAELLRLASNPSMVDSVLNKKATHEGGSSDVASEVANLDAEIGRLMDLLQEDALVSVSEIAGRISAVHEKRVRLLGSVEPGPMKLFKAEAFKQILRDVDGCWRDLDIRGRRALLFQLFDGIHVDSGGIRVDCSVRGLASYSRLNLSKKAQSRQHLE